MTNLERIIAMAEKLVDEANAKKEPREAIIIANRFADAKNQLLRKQREETENEDEHTN